MALKIGSELEKLLKDFTAVVKKNVQVGKDQERRNQKKIPTPKTEVGKNQTNNQVLIP